MTLRGLPPRLRWFIGLVATAGLLASTAVVVLEPGTWDRSPGRAVRKTEPKGG